MAEQTWQFCRDVGCRAWGSMAEMLLGLSCIANGQMSKGLQMVEAVRDSYQLKEDRTRLAFIQPAPSGSRHRGEGIDMGKEGNRASEELIRLAMESMAVAVTIIDKDGLLVYYNQAAEKILDRRPEYIGRDVHSHHQQEASNRKLDGMLQAFRQGRTDPFLYEAKPYGKPILVSLSPILKDGRFIGCTQCVRLKQSP